MRRNIFIAILSLLLCACSKTDRTLDSVENAMIENPDMAFDTLVRIDTLSMSEGHKARRALLQAYIATIYVAPVHMTPSDLTRALTAFDGKCTPDEVKSMIIKSEFAKANGDPVGRLELLKDAEFLASQLGDKSDLAFIYLYLSKVYSNGFNGTVSQHYANKSLLLFKELGYRKQSIDARMAIVGALAVKRDYATMLDSMLSMKNDVLTYSTDSYKQYFLDQLARSLDENGRSHESIEIWHSIYDGIDGTSSNTLAHWARAYIHVNHLDSAELLIDKALALQHNCSDEYLCRNVQYDIIERLGRESELPTIDSLRQLAANIDYDERKIADSSLALNKKYETATQMAWNERQQAQKRSTIVIFCATLLLFITSAAILFYRKRSKLLQLENENNLLKLQRLENNLFEKEKTSKDVAVKIAALFKSRFCTIDRLATAYFECKETGQEQKRIFSETKSAIDKFSSEASLQELEDIINAARNNLIIHFDEDFPRLSSSQRKLALFIFCGLSLQSISIFLGADIRNIYVYKSRLKSTIAKSGAPRKALYLAYFA